MTKVYVTKCAITRGVEEATLGLSYSDGMYVDVKYVTGGCKDTVHKKHVFYDYAEAAHDCRLKVKKRIASLTDQIQGLNTILNLNLV